MCITQGTFVRNISVSVFSFRDAEQSHSVSVPVLFFQAENKNYMSVSVTFFISLGSGIGIIPARVVPSKLSLVPSGTDFSDCSMSWTYRFLEDTRRPHIAFSTGL